MNSAILRYLLIAAVRHLVNFATVVDSVGRNLLPSKRGLATTLIGAEALINAHPDDRSRHTLIFPISVRLHFTQYLFYVNFSSCPNTTTSAKALYRESGRQNVSSLFGVKIQARVRAVKPDKGCAQ